MKPKPVEISFSPADNQRLANLCGVLDENLNFVVDPGEKKVYFEVGGFGNYVFFENPH